MFFCAARYENFAVESIRKRFFRLCGALRKSGEHSISYSSFFRALETARVHPITRYTLLKHKPTLIIEKKNDSREKSGNARKRKPGGVKQTHLRGSQRVNKLLRSPKLGIICLIRRRQCEQVLMRSRTDLSTDLRSISDRSHLSDLSMNGTLVAIKSQVWALITTLFKNIRTLKFKSCLRNCVFGCRQHNYDHKQRSYAETHKADRNPPITNFLLLRDPLR